MSKAESSALRRWRLLVGPALMTGSVSGSSERKKAMKTPSIEECKTLNGKAGLHRGMPMIDGLFVTAIINGVPLNYQRRRYSACTFTWVEAHVGGKWVSLGDPWPCLNPKRSELETAIKFAQEQVMPEPTGACL